MINFYKQPSTPFLHLSHCWRETQWMSGLSTISFLKRRPHWIWGNGSYTCSTALPLTITYGLSIDACGRSGMQGSTFYCLYLIKRKLSTGTCMWTMWVFNSLKLENLWPPKTGSGANPINFLKFINHIELVPIWLKRMLTDMDGDVKKWKL